MKLLVKVIIVLAMMCVGVQGYAQHRRPMPRHHYPHHVYHRPVYHYSPYYDYSYYGYRYIPYSAYVWYPIYGYWYYAPLGLYLYGHDYKSPEKIKVDVVEFKRTARGRLRIINGTEKKIYLGMYEKHHLRYTCPSGTKIDVKTGDGTAKITASNAEGQIVAEHTL